MIGVFHSGMAGGPGQVVYNLLRGLEKLNIPYQNNKIGDYNIVLQNNSILYKGIKINNLFLGPNVFDIPTDNPQIGMDFSNYKKLIVHSEWMRKLYLKYVPDEKVAIWNCGIDTDFFKIDDKKFEYDFLIYLKRRTQQDLDTIIDFIKSKNKTFVLIKYGDYSMNYFLDTISKSKYAFIINNSETGGIAMQELLSCNIPLLVWDVDKWTDRGENLYCDATSIPYFDSRCGEKFYSLDELETTYNKFISTEYNPREYALENCNYITQTQKILDIIQQ
jgi:glycosyltransferase involved in cell wall biosynthesis